MARPSSMSILLLFFTLLQALSGKRVDIKDPALTSQEEDWTPGSLEPVERSEVVDEDVIHIESEASALKDEDEHSGVVEMGATGGSGGNDCIHASLDAAEEAARQSLNAFKQGEADFRQHAKAKSEEAWAAKASAEARKSAAKEAVVAGLKELQLSVSDAASAKTYADIEEFEDVLPDDVMVKYHLWLKYHALSSVKLGWRSYEEPAKQLKEQLSLRLSGAQQAAPGKSTSKPDIWQPKTIDVVGFPEKANGSRVEVFNGRYTEDLTGMKCVNGKQTYWQPKSATTPFIYFCKSNNRWVIAVESSWAQVASGNCQMHASFKSGTALVPGKSQIDYAYVGGITDDLPTRLAKIGKVERDVWMKDVHIKAEGVGNDVEVDPAKADCARHQDSLGKVEASSDPTAAFAKAEAAWQAASQELPDVFQRFATTFQQSQATMMNAESQSTAFESIRMAFNQIAEYYDTCNKHTHDKVMELPKLRDCLEAPVKSTMLALAKDEGYADQNQAMTELLDKVVKVEALDEIKCNAEEMRNTCAQALA